MSARSASLALALTLAAAVPAAAQLGQDVGVRQGVPYACVGFGSDERSDPRWQGYPLKIEYATATGGYYADAVTTVRDASGAVVFEAHCQAPWLLLRLPPGKYRLTGRALPSNEARTARVTVKPQGQTRVVIRFPGIKN